MSKGGRTPETERNWLSKGQNIPSKELAFNMPSKELAFNIASKELAFQYTKQGTKHDTYSNMTNT